MCPERCVDMSSSIESKLVQIEEAIQQDLQKKGRLGGVARNFAIVGGICVLGLVLVKAPVFLMGAAVAGAGFAVTSWMRSECDKGLDRKYQTQATLLIAQEAQRGGAEPAPKPSADENLRSGFAQTAAPDARIDKLEEAVDELRRDVGAPPATLDKPKRFLGGFRKE